MSAAANTADWTATSAPPRSRRAEFGAAKRPPHDGGDERRAEAEHDVGDRRLAGVKAPVREGSQRSELEHESQDEVGCRERAALSHGPAGRARDGTGRAA